MWAALSLVARAQDICDTCPFTGIQAAVASVPAGGAADFTIGPGTYAEPAPIVISDERAISITATGGGVTVTRAGSGAVFVVQGDALLPTPPSLELVGLSVTAFNDRPLRATLGEVVLEDCVLYMVGIVDEGGAISVDRGTLTVRDSVFLDTFATTQGGHVLARDATVDIAGSVFRRGFARIGGSIALESLDAAVDEASITDCRFEDDIAAESGGAIAVRGGVALTVRDSVFLRNAALTGGALAERTEPGAPITQLTLTGSTFEENVAQGDGGALAIVDAPALVTDNTFLANTAGLSGGAAWIGGGATTLARNLLCGNEAAEGGGVATLSSGTQDWSNNRFVENEAFVAGGAVLHKGGPLAVEHANLLGNSAPSGGAIATSGALTLERNLIGWTDGPAVRIVASGALDGEYNAWWRNDAGNVDGGEVDATDVHQDPLLVRYEPGLGCDAVDDYYSWYGPLRDAAPSGPSLEADLDGTLPDVGAYGGRGAVEAPWLDGDGDGFPAVYDCLEGDELWHPDPDRWDDDDVERWYDGLDQDCDGASDFDRDRDGFDDERFGGDDCDDDEPEVNPAADEQPGQGDQDCDGVVDADGDGVSPPDDCDDADPRVHPGATEDPDPTVDLDCVGPADVVRPLVPAQCGSVGSTAWGPALLALWAIRKKRRARVTRRA